jgi:hypothetical protein
MISLNTLTKLELKLGSNPAIELDWYVDYIDTSNDTVGKNEGLSTGINDVVLVNVPTSDSRLIRYLNIYNPNTTAVSVIIKTDISTVEKILIKHTLESEETLVYDSQSGWKIALKDFIGEKNVQSDWNQTTNTEDDYIKNKPDTITPTQSSEINSNTIHSNSTHAPTDAEKNVQSDWNQTTNTEDDYIKNKPTISPIAQIVKVAISGGNFTSVKAAIDSITDATVNKPYAVRIYPGVYTEDPITMKSYVDVTGVGWGTPQIKATDNNSPLFTMALNSRLASLSIYGGTNEACILSNVPISYIENIIFETGLIGLRSTGSGNKVLIEESKSKPAVGTSLVSESNSTLNTSSFLCYSDKYFHADGGIMWIQNSGGNGGSLGLYANNGGKIYPHNVAFEETTITLKTGTTGINYIEGGGVYARGTRTYDIVQENSTGHIRLGTCLLDDTLFNITNWVIIDIDFNSESEGDEGFHVIKELHVGIPERGSETVLGEGDSYTRGMMIYTYNHTTTIFTDVSDEAKSASGSTLQVPGTAVGNAIYMSSDLNNGTDYLKFAGIKANVLTSITDGWYDFEFWNGTSWEYINTMSTQSNKPYLPYAWDVFYNTGSQQIRFNNDSLNDWVKNDPISSGTNRYWVRVIVGGITTGTAVLEQIKLHSNRSEFNSDGYQEYFGTARPISNFLWDFGLMKPSTNSPADQDLYLSDKISVGRVENKFTNGVTDRQGYNGYIPFDIDTSCNLKLRWSYITDDTSAGDIFWVIRWGHTTDDDSVFRTTTTAPTTGPNEQTMILIESAPSVEDTQITVEASLHIEELISRRESGFGDILWISLERQGGDVLDTHNGDVSIIQSSGFYTKWCEGGHV